MIHLLKVTAFNMPRLTRLSGVALALLVGLAHLWALTHSEAPGYVRALFVVAVTGALLAALGIVAGLRSLGWHVAVTTSGLGLLAYVLSRAVGLPGFAAAVGAWHNPLGTVTATLELLLLVLYVSLLVGWNVDTVGARDWDTYFSHPRR